MSGTQIGIGRSGGQEAERTPAQKVKPRPRRTRVDRLTTAWMVVAVALLIYAKVFGETLSQEWWTTVHVVTLGVITNAILQWSWYFSRSLLRLPPTDKHSGAHQTARQVLFNVAVALLVAAMWIPSAAGAVVAAAAIGVIISWHVLALVLASKTALGARFAVIVRYYTAAGALLVVGVVYGALTIVPLISAAPPERLLTMQDGLTVAHSLVNGLGWIGLTVAGTLVTLGPTALRTLMDEGAVARAVQALPVLVIAVVGATLAATWELFWLAGVFVAVYTGVLIWGVGVPLLNAAKRKPLNEVATWSFAAGCVWSVLGLVWLSGALFTAGDAAVFRESSRLIVAVIGVGGILQILVGALSYLLPVVVGGGPAAVRVGIQTIEVGGGFRFASRNAALLVAVAIAASPGISGAMSTFVAVVAASFALEIGVFAQAGLIQARSKKTREGQRFEGASS